MSFTVINNPKKLAEKGFTNAQFKKLDGLYLKACSEKVFTYRTIDFDFEEGVAIYAYHKAEAQPPALQFIIRQVGPRTMMYEVFDSQKGRIKKSGVFDIAFQRLEDEISTLLS